MKIGIDLGGSHIAVGIVTEDGKILSKQEQNISFIDFKDDSINIKIRDTIVSLINAVLRDAKIPIFLVKEIGIAIPGIVEDNKIKKCSKFGIYDWDIAKELEEHYAVDVKLENDALCAALAEKEYGNLKDIDNAVFICLGTGIGGANIIDNKVLSAEYGHMIIEKQGIECNCGNRGCFENYCSMRVFKEQLIKLLELKPDTTSEELRKILLKEDRNIDNYINEYIDNLIIGISNIINIINPETICIGGGFTYFKDILYPRLLEKAELTTYQFNKPKIVIANLGNDAGIIGATLI